MQNLTQLFDSFGSDKGRNSGCRHNYGAVYGTLFEPLRAEKVRLLEFGVATGSSICAWLEYFPEGEIYGVDCSMELLKSEVPRDNQRLHLLQGDVTDPAIVPDLKYDIMIDDSDHATDTQVRTLLTHWPKLVAGGYYIIEDLLVGKLPLGAGCFGPIKVVSLALFGIFTFSSAELFPKASSGSVFSQPGKDAGVSF